MSQTVTDINSAISSLNSATNSLHGSTSGMRDAYSTLSSAVDGLNAPTNPSEAVNLVTSSITTSSNSFVQSAGSITQVTGGVSRISGALGSLLGGTSVGETLTKAAEAVNQATSAVREASQVAGQIAQTAEMAQEIVGFMEGLPAAVTEAFNDALSIFGIDSANLASSMTAYTTEKEIFYDVVQGFPAGGIVGSPITETVSWTILDDNAQNIIDFTSFFEADITNEGDTASYPQENGAFSSYNKVETPLNIRVTLGIQGDEGAFSVALNQLDIFKREAVTLFVVTPARVYENMTLQSYNYKRAQDAGAHMLVVELVLVEIRNVQTQVLSRAPAWSPQNPTGDKTQDNGLQQSNTIAYDIFDMFNFFDKGS